MTDRISMKVRGAAPKKTFSVRLSVDLIEWIQKRMQDEDRSSSWIIAEALELQKRLGQYGEHKEEKGGVQKCIVN